MPQMPNKNSNARQFLTVLKKEYSNIAGSKGYKIFLIVVAFILIVGLFLPPIFMKDNGDSETPGTSSTSEPAHSLTVIDKAGIYSEEALKAAFPDYKATITTDDSEDALNKLKNGIKNGDVDTVINVKSSTDIIYYSSGSMFDSFYGTLTDFAASMHSAEVMSGAGMTDEQVASALTKPVITMETVGKDQANHYGGTYAMLMLMYMAIILFGQMVTSAVVNEKNSRAMELLITAAKPLNLMFGKILGVGLAGLTMLGVWIATAAAGLSLNADFYKNIPILTSMFDMGPELIAYFLLFFCIGYFMFSAVYAAVGSLVSRMEEIQLYSTPVILVYMVGFFVSIFGMNMPNSMLLKVCSYIPITSPMCMFVRISMSEVPLYGIAISVVLAIATTVLIAQLAAKIYRIGVLMYGKPPSIKELIKTLKETKNY